MRHLVLGTAGHIDHGKSALVHALTGVHPDRLKEEQLRGITIELGFADLTLERGVVSIVDVPGHERFVRQMVAGASGIDAVLLVVAADQAIQPQTREHLDVCALLGIRRGVVAVTKSDLVDDELREVAELEVQEFLEGTFLEGAPVVPVSAKTGDGLGALRAALSGLFDAVSVRPSDGIARLPVDRSFVLRGFGTVVTGTLVSGRLAVGAEIDVLPHGRRARIRGLQVHGSSVEEVAAGQRVAVNLQGVDCAEAPRGATLVTPGIVEPSRRAWVRLTLLPGAPKKLIEGGPVRFHHGTCDRAARLRVLDVPDEGPLHAELYLAEEAVLVPGDRFILRRPAPVDTIGGGQIVDAHPPRPRDAGALAFAEEALGPELATRLRLSRAGLRGSSPAEVGAALGLPPALLDEAVGGALEDGAVVVAAGRWYDGAIWRRAVAAATEAVAAFHVEQPLSMGMNREELRGKVASSMPQDAFRQLLEALAAAATLRLDGERVAVAGHTVVFAEGERKLAERLESGFRAAGLEPPELDALLTESGGRDSRSARQIVDVLIADGKLVRIQDGRLFHAVALEELRSRVRAYGETSPTIDVAAFKQLAGVTRKNAIPLLEQLDAERMTRRVGNFREIL